MPRIARADSAAGIFHVMLRGINRQNIFEDSEDYERFVTCVSDAKKRVGIKVYGYCLMSNHVHLAIGAPIESVSNSIKRIGVSYVSYYNRKYDRQGPLFQDRFKSEPIEDDNYFLSVLRYIHQNPVKAGLCKRVDIYKWSSYMDYAGTGAGVTETGLALMMFSEKTADQARLFIEFSDIDASGIFIDIGNAAHTSDESLRKLLVDVCGASSAGEFQALHA
jgi:REP element-mobilizing transposase RayT